MQLTSARTCKRKRTYNTSATAGRAVKRRNASGKKFLVKYQCNVCNYWHVTAQEQEKI